MLTLTPGPCPLGLRWPDADPCGLRGARVLVADGDPRAAAAHAGAIGAAGCAVTLAKDGAEALDLIVAGIPFDLLVTDLCLPRLDGAGLIRHLRRVRPWCPVVVAASVPPPDGVRGLCGRGEGPLLLLDKPVAPARLVAAAALAACRAARPSVARCPLAAAGDAR